MKRQKKEFTSSDFAHAFARNAEHATYEASATFRGARLHVKSCDPAHYQRTLDYWQKTLKVKGIQTQG